MRTYTVQVSPGGATQQVSGTSMVWSGLTNGTAYTFRIQAHNDDPNPSDWSASSVPVVPAGVPLQPAAPQAVKDSADRVLGLIKWGSLVCCIGALLGFGFLVAAAERGGYGSGAAEFKERFGKVILAIVVVTTAVPIVLFVMG